MLYSSSGKVELSVAGKGASKFFANESGKHVVQRVPSTEKKGRRQTSIITVAVIPMSREFEYALLEGDIDVKITGGSGPGGQHQNKVQTAVKMTHIPTGITASSNGRSQKMNRREARCILESRVSDHFKKQGALVRSKNKATQVDGGGRGNKVRTYNFIESRVTNNITGKKTNLIKKVMRGNLDLIN